MRRVTITTEDEYQHPSEDLWREVPSMHMIHKAKGISIKLEIKPVSESDRSPYQYTGKIFSSFCRYES